MEPEVYHLFEKYLNNDLSDLEKAEFEKRISDDSEFADTFETYKDIQSSLKSKEERAEGEEALRQNLSTLSNDFFNNASEEKETKVIPMRRWIQLAAASVILILSVTFFFNRDQPKPTYANYANYEILALTERGEEYALKLHAENYFNDKQYEKAVSALDELLQKEPENTQAKLYLGIALTETDQFDRAEKLFKEVKDGNSIFTNKASWHLALAYLKQDKIEECKSALQEIPESADEYEKAKELLEGL